MIVLEALLGEFNVKTTKALSGQEALTLFSKGLNKAQTI
jgi:two-component system sensor histidine kinase BarA